MFFYIILVLLLLLIFLPYKSISNTSDRLVYLSSKPTSSSYLFLANILQRFYGYNTNSDPNICDKMIMSVYKTSQQDLRNILKNHDYKVIFTIPNNYVIGSKKTLWQVIKNKYGGHASEIMPYCYSLPEEYQSYKQNYNKKERIIFKTGDQRQKGLFLTDELVPIEKVKDKKYIVAQKFLEHGQRFYGHKINIRLYLIIKVSAGKCSAWLANDGIISYGIKDKERSDISSFYESKQLYDQNYPNTVKNLFKGNTPEILKKATHKLKLLMESCKDLFENGVSIKNNQCYEIFGVDFLLTDENKLYLIEINCCPGMEPYKNEDTKARTNVYVDYMDLVHNKPNNLIKII